MVRDEGTIDDLLVETDFSNDQRLVEQIISDNHKAVIFFLGKRCFPVIQYINHTRLKGLDLNDDDLINDFYLFLNENQWEKLRSFRFESKIQTWINVVASRYLLKKYGKQLKEKSLKNSSLDGIPLYSDEENCGTLIQGELLDAIAHLEDKRSQHVLLLTLQGYDSQEIGKKLDTSVNNVYVIKSRAVEKLKSILK